MDQKQRNDQAMKNFLYPKRVLAEEVLHKNPDAKILPIPLAPAELPPIEAMIPILHKTCGEVAFYYTHVPKPGTMMMSTLARTVDGKPIERGAPMVCHSCKEYVEGPGYLQVRRSDYEASS